MKTYRVLWFEDDHNQLEIIKDGANANGILLHAVTNEEDGLRELEKGLHLYDAVVVDGKFYRKPDQSGDALDDNAWVSVARYFDRVADKKKMPWFILSGQTSITKGKNQLVEIFMDSKVYDKNNDDDIQQLWGDIKTAVEDQYDTQLRHKYQNAFDVCTPAYLGADTATSLLYLLKTIEGDKHDSDTQERINSLRKILEKLFFAFNRIGILPSEVLKEKGGLNNSKNFLCGTLKSSYKLRQEILPPAIKFLLNNLTLATQDGSHSDGDLSVRADHFIRSQPTGYFFKSMVFQLLEILVWLKHYFDEHTDYQSNQLIAIPIETDKTHFEGVIEQDGFNNYFCGEYLLSYKAIDGKFKLGDCIKITAVSDNSQSKTSHLYKKFGLRFVKID